MRRGLVATGLAVVVTGGVVGAIGAAAGPVPLHELKSVTAVHSAVKALDLTSDFGTVTLQAGPHVSVAADEQWNYSQPTLTVAVKNGVLSVRAACPSLLDGPDVYASDPGVNQCAVNLAITVPASTEVAIEAYGNSVTSAGINGAQKIKALGGSVSVNASRSRTVTVESGDALAFSKSTVGVATLTSDSGRVTVNDVMANTASLRAEGADVAVADSHIAHALSAVSDNSSVALRDVSAGELTATGESGAVDVESTHVIGAATLNSENSGVTVNQLSAARLVATGYSGAVLVKDTVVRDDAALTAEDGPVSVDSLRAAALSMEAATGDATLSTATVTGPVHVVSENGGASLQDLHADQLVVEASTGSLSIGSTVVRGQLSASNSNGGVAMSDVRAAAMSVRATGGTLAASDVASPDVSATNDNGPVTVSLAKVPQHVVIESSANIDLSVPAATYAVNAVSDSGGPVTVSGLVVHSDAKRSLTAHTTQGSVSITGR